MNIDSGTHRVESGQLLRQRSTVMPWREFFVEGERENKLMTQKNFLARDSISTVDF